MSSSGSAVSVSLDDLIAFNDQIRAMTAAGVPLEEGLVRFAEESPGRAGELARDWAARLKAGEPLSKLVDTETHGIPRLYRAVLAAGLRVGRLGAALQAMGVSARRVADTRQLVSASLTYPLIVFLLGNFVVFVFVLFALPTILEFHHDFGLQQDAWYRASQSFKSLMDYVGLWPAVIVFVAAVIWWFGSGRAGAMQPGWAKFWFGWLPGMNFLFVSVERACFAEVLSLLVAQQVPMPEALLLSGEASGNPELEAGAKEAAERISRGDTNREPPAGLPPFLGWLIMGGSAGSDLSKALAQAAQRYRVQATRQADWQRVFLPVLLTLVLGGGVTLIYAVIALGPWFSMMQQMSAPID